MKKRYLSELLGDEYKKWKNKKVILVAPTGMGKTTFIIEVLLPYLRRYSGKLLILCNRKLLRMQYWYALVGKYDSYTELEESVVIMTYQQLAEKIRNGCKVEYMFKDYEAVVCDEAHYFYADSDFNGFGTYGLLQAIVLAGVAKELIFMTATATEVAPLIKRTITNCITKLSRRTDGEYDYYAYGEIIERDFSHLMDYERFQCIAVPDDETLCGLLAESQKKSIMFIDDKSRSERIKALLEKTGKIKSNAITVLNAENLEDGYNGTVVRNLAISHRLLPKILITTSVLDNGVSIHDVDVENIVIITESRISFLQMLGRVRAESSSNCKLYFVCREADAFQARMKRYKEECEWFKELQNANIDRNPYPFLSTVWDRNDERKAEFYQKALVLTTNDYDFFSLSETKTRSIYGDTCLRVNEFAKRKIGDMYVAESNMYALSLNDSLEPIYEQMRWLGKEPEELLVLSSNYKEMRKQELIGLLLSVNNISQEELKSIKVRLVKEYRKEFFPEILAQNGTLSQDKLQEICSMLGLHYRSATNPDDNRKRYFIEKAELVEEKEEISYAPISE